MPRYFYDYIYPAVMLLGLSYLALFVDKQNPGRPGIHSVTVLTELTLASAQRQQLPPVNDEMWIMQFQNTILICHILIFLEFGVVHYAARQIQRQRAKHKDDAEFLMGAAGGAEYYDGAGVSTFRSEYRSEDLASISSRRGGGAGGGAPRAAGGGADPRASRQGQGVQRSDDHHDNGAGRRSNLARSTATSSDAGGGGGGDHAEHGGFTTGEEDGEEDAALGMPSVAGMLGTHLSRPASPVRTISRPETLSHHAADNRGCCSRLLWRSRGGGGGDEELSEMIGYLAKQGAVRARTWHRCVYTCRAATG
jgi:hypothetical protein